MTTTAVADNVDNDNDDNVDNDDDDGNNSNDKDDDDYNAVMQKKIWTLGLEKSNLRFFCIPDFSVISHPLV